MVHDQSLVIWKNIFPRTDRRQVSWLAALCPSPSRFPSGRAFWRPTDSSAYSDEIAQAFHLFPFYPLPPSGRQGHRLTIQFCYSISPYQPRCQDKRAVIELSLGCRVPCVFDDLPFRALIGADAPEQRSEAALFHHPGGGVVLRQAYAEDLGEPHFFRHGR